MEQIAYRDGYRYQLAEDYTFASPILPDVDISTRFVKLTRAGLLTIREDYAWDGPSGPTADTLSTMRAALVHDALYSLMREGKLDHGRWRAVVDRIFRNILLEDGVFPPRAEFFYRGVQQFGDPYADPAHVKPVMRAPAMTPSASPPPAFA